MTALNLSKDPSTKVGAVIVSLDGRKVSTGYNGYPRGADDSTMGDRALKYPRVIHAEANAIINCPFDTEGSTMYCSLCPCSRCLALIINAGIRRVVFYGEDKWERDPNPEVFSEFEGLLIVHCIRHDQVVEALDGLYSASASDSVIG
jgi:dCMP deaminase